VQFMAALWLALVFSLSGLAADAKRDPAQIGIRKIGRGLNIYSHRREIALGRRLAKDVEREVWLLQDDVITGYVNRIGQNLVRNSDDRDPLIVKVVRSDDINAFALPGGFLYLTTGLIRIADNEAQLAGALAHEIAHVAARHTTKRETRNQLSMPLIFLGGLPGCAIRLFFLRLSRGAELEADMLGLQYLYKTGYDPAEFVNLLEKLGTIANSPGPFARMLSVHPTTSNRIRAARKEINNDLRQQVEYINGTPDFGLVKARLSGSGTHLNVSIGNPLRDAGHPDGTESNDTLPLLESDYITLP
jgi:predicted Zn-dependent protease